MKRNWGQKYHSHESRAARAKHNAIWVFCLVHCFTPTSRKCVPRASRKEVKVEKKTRITLNFLYPTYQSEQPRRKRMERNLSCSPRCHIRFQMQITGQQELKIPNFFLKNPLVYYRNFGYNIKRMVAHFSSHNRKFLKKLVFLVLYVKRRIFFPSGLSEQELELEKNGNWNKFVKLK